MVKCSYCGREIINPATHYIYVTKTGRIYHFCSGKCRKNFLLGRNPKKVKWTLLRSKAKIRK